jgi:anti-anti-sigma factor
MSENQQLATSDVRDDVAVVAIHLDHIRDADTAYALRDRILAVIDEAGTQKVILDLTQVTFLGSVGFLAFLAVRRHLQTGRIVIANCSEPIYRAFEICRLVSRTDQKAPFEAADSIDEALELLAA